MKLMIKDAEQKLLSLKLYNTLPNTQDGPPNSKGNRYWVSATVQNAVQEQKAYATQFEFSQMPAAMHIFLSVWGAKAGSGVTPMLGHGIQVLSSSVNVFAGIFLTTNQNQVGKAALIGTLLGIDIAMDYGLVNQEFLSDQVKTVAYHEMCHASDFTHAGLAWYQQFVSAELAEMLANPIGTQYMPFGTGKTANSPIIALGESWGYHMGHFLAEQQYGVNAFSQSEQPDANGNGIEYSTTTGTGHPNYDVLEYFQPGLASDPFKWIPKGLMYDLIDNGEPFSIKHVNDLVSGYTNGQIFAALQSDVTTISQYKTRLLQQNLGNTTNGNLNALFTSYGF